MAVNVHTGVTKTTLLKITIIMKNKSLLKSMLGGLAILALTTSLTSCKKNDVDESGSAKIKVINASSASADQGFYLANSAVVQGGLGSGEASDDYILTNSGKNLVTEFRTVGSSTPYATGKSDFDNGKEYSVFLVGEGQSARIKVYTDDNSAPTSGQAKVRFIHLSDAAPANVDVKRGDGTPLVANLARDNASNYVTIEPGILRLQVSQNGQSANLGEFSLSAFQANKIYTVYITGSTANNIAVRQITHN